MITKAVRLLGSFEQKQVRIIDLTRDGLDCHIGTTMRHRAGHRAEMREEREASSYLFKPNVYIPKKNRHSLHSPSLPCKQKILRQIEMAYHHKKVQGMKHYAKKKMEHMLSRPHTHTHLIDNFTIRCEHPNAAPAT